MIYDARGNAYCDPKRIGFRREVSVIQESVEIQLSPPPLGEVWRPLSEGETAHEWPVYRLRR